MKRSARTFHRRFWMVFAIVLPISFLAILSLKQNQPVNAGPLLLEAPQ